jgi:hypothetical protein
VRKKKKSKNYTEERRKDVRQKEKRKIEGNEEKTRERRR